MSTHLGSQPNFGYARAETITTTKTLVAADSGKVFYLESSGGAYTITLPSVAAGINFLFLCQEDTPTGDITITAGSAILHGLVVSSGTTTEATAGTAKTSFYFDTTTKKGSSAELFCDGTSWYLRGMGDPDNWCVFA